jgi:hypothetical protein
MIDDDKSKHLEFIQNVIARMANNSFLLKGWAVTLVAAFFALAAQNTNLNFVVLGFFPVIAFWILDAYYLRQERLFRLLFNAIRVKDADKVQPNELFLMDTSPYEGKVQSWFRIMFSKTIGIFYGTIIITLIIIVIVLKLFSKV